MRGALNHSCACRNLRRIIPADAGSTHDEVKPIGMHWDHPRGCGEHKQGRYASYTNRGSSPRMRGARALPGGHVLIHRIIPADAGSTTWS